MEPAHKDSHLAYEASKVSGPFFVESMHGSKYAKIAHIVENVLKSYLGTEAHGVSDATCHLIADAILIRILGGYLLGSGEIAGFIQSSEDSLVHLANNLPDLFKDPQMRKSLIAEGITPEGARALTLGAVAVIAPVGKVVHKIVDALSHGAEGVFEAVGSNALTLEALPLSVEKEILEEGMAAARVMAAPFHVAGKVTSLALEGLSEINPLFSAIFRVAGTAAQRVGHFAKTYLVPESLKDAPERFARDFGIDPKRTKDFITDLGVLSGSSLSGTAVWGLGKMAKKPLQAIEMPNKDVGMGEWFFRKLSPEDLGKEIKFACLTGSFEGLTGKAALRYLDALYIDIPSHITPRVFIARLGYIQGEGGASVNFMKRVAEAANQTGATHLFLEAHFANLALKRKLRMSYGLSPVPHSRNGALFSLCLDKVLKASDARALSEMTKVVVGASILGSGTLDLTKGYSRFCSSASAGEMEIRALEKKVEASPRRLIAPSTSWMPYEEGCIEKEVLEEGMAAARVMAAPLHIIGKVVSIGIEQLSSLNNTFGALFKGLAIASEKVGDFAKSYLIPNAFQESIRWAPNRFLSEYGVVGTENFLADLGVLTGAAIGGLVARVLGGIGQTVPLYYASKTSSIPLSKSCLATTRGRLDGRLDIFTTLQNKKIALIDVGFLQGYEGAVLDLVNKIRRLSIRNDAILLKAHFTNRRLKRLLESRYHITQIGPDLYHFHRTSKVAHRIFGAAVGSAKLPKEEKKPTGFSLLSQAHAGEIGMLTKAPSSRVVEIFKQAKLEVTPIVSAGLEKEIRELREYISSSDSLKKDRAILQATFSDAQKAARNFNLPKLGALFAVGQQMVVLEGAMDRVSKIKDLYSKEGATGLFSLASAASSMLSIFAALDRDSGSAMGALQDQMRTYCLQLKHQLEATRDLILGNHEEVKWEFSRLRHEISLVGEHLKALCLHALEEMDYVKTDVATGFEKMSLQLSAFEKEAHYRLEELSIEPLKKVEDGLTHYEVGKFSIETIKGWAVSLELWIAESPVKIDLLGSLISAYVYVLKCLRNEQYAYDVRGILWQQKVRNALEARQKAVTQESDMKQLVEIQKTAEAGYREVLAMPLIGKGSLKVTAPLFKAEDKLIKWLEDINALAESILDWAENENGLTAEFDIPSSGAKLLLTLDVTNSKLKIECSHEGINIIPICRAIEKKFKTSDVLKDFELVHIADQC
jgi:hypothetical protein